jgi:thiazole/oxazole-forming peptide maturase SagD family component
MIVSDIQVHSKKTKEVITYSQKHCLTAWSSAHQAERPSHRPPTAVTVAEELAAATRRSELITRLQAEVMNRGMVLSLPAFFPFFNDEPRFPAVSGILLDWRGKPLDTLGALSLSKDDAMLRCLGEIVERYYQHYPAVGKRTTITNDPEGEPCLDVLKLFPVGGLDAGQLNYWTQVTSVKDNSTLWAPTQSCYLQFDRTCPVLDPFRTTNGTAFGWNYDDAVFSGLCEVIERDAFIVHFLGKITPPKVNLIHLSSKIFDLVKYMERYKLQVQLFDISLDQGMPVVMALVLDYLGVGPAVSIGTSCGPSVEQCVIKALLEAQQSRIYSRTSMMESLDNGPRNVFDEISKAWYSIESIEKLDFFLNSTEFSYMEDCRTDRAAFIRQFQLPVYVKSLSPPDFTLGEVVKIIVPDLVPLYFSEDTIQIKHERLGKYTGRTTIEGGLHPFL